jgi:hypothetical protein
MPGRDCEGPFCRVGWEVDCVIVFMGWKTQESAPAELTNCLMCWQAESIGLLLCEERNKFELYANKCLR